MPSRDAVSRSISRLRLEAAGLLIAGDIAQFGQRRKLIEHSRRPRCEFLRIGIFQAVLILRAADAILDGEVLHRLHEHRDAVNRGACGCRRRITSVALVSRCARAASD